MADPATFVGSDEERRRAFREAFLVLRRRIELFIALPLEKLSGYGLHEELATIGKHQTESGSPVS